MMQSAWEEGLDGSKIPGLTPSEAVGYFESNNAIQRRKMASMDRMAWLIGSYCAVGVNQPKKFPKKPRNADKIMQAGKQKKMTDEEMQSFAFAFAERWNNACKSGNAADPV